MTVVDEEDDNMAKMRRKQELGTNWERGEEVEKSPVFNFPVSLNLSILMINLISQCKKLLISDTDFLFVSH